MQREQNAIDFLKDNLQAVNKRRYLQTVKQQIILQQSQQQKQSNKIPSQQQLSKTLQQYSDLYLKFMYKDTLMTNAKSNGMIDQCLNNVHPGLKTKKDCKYILSIMSKILVQELVQQTLEVVQEYKKGNVELQSKGVISNNEVVSKGRRQQQIDIDVLEQAIRRRQLKKEHI